MKVLSIGNSFSQDAQRYLKGVCDAAGVEIKNVNLYIGGCTLLRHYNNMIGDIADYELEMYGESCGKTVTMKEILTSDDWDVITLQEASPRSTEIYHYEPYISALAKYVRELCPKAKIALHETWGYDEGTNRIKNLGFYKHRDMFFAIEKCYTEIKDHIGAEIIIPSGKTMQLLFDQGFLIHRDGFHASLGLGRYAIALTWLKTLFGVKVFGNSFCNFDEDQTPTPEEIKAAWEVVDSLKI